VLKNPNIYNLDRQQFMFYNQKEKRQTSAAEVCDSVCIDIWCTGRCDIMDVHPSGAL
jgi:hypothetical protein